MKPNPEKYHKIVLNYGKTDGTNLSNMPSDNYFSIGYNDKWGLVDVLEGHGEDGTPIFEGKLNIESLLAQLPQRTETTAKQIDKTVENVIMEAYSNFWNYKKNPEKDTTKPTPILEV